MFFCVNSIVWDARKVTRNTFLLLFCSLSLINSIQSQTITPNIKGLSAIEASSVITDTSNDSAVNTTYAKGDVNHTPYGIPVAGYVQINDVDLEGDNQTFSLVSGMPPEEGTLVFNPDGYYVFTPALGFAGLTAFEYQVCDDAVVQACDEAKVLITVLETIDTDGHHPVAICDFNVTRAGYTLSGEALANDFDPDHTTMEVIDLIADVGNFSGTSVELDVPTAIGGWDNNGNTVENAGIITLSSSGYYTFEPAANFKGEVKVEYTIEDESEFMPNYIPDDEEDEDIDNETQNSIPIVIKVREYATNTTFASDDAVVLDRGTSTTGNLIVNDFDAEMDFPSISLLEIDNDADGTLESAVLPGFMASVSGINAIGSLIPDVGMLTVQSNGDYEFIPDVDFVGNVVVPYTMCDDANPSKCSKATLTISVLDVAMDYSDAPAIYPVAWHRGMSDNDNDNVLDGGVDVWLGENTNLENTAFESATGTGDAYDDGMELDDLPLYLTPSTEYNINVKVNTNIETEVYIGMWIDYDEDGIYDQFYTENKKISELATKEMTIMTPSDLTASGVTGVNIRVRVDNHPFGAGDFAGERTNGEVEDYRIGTILPVELLYFEGETWETCTNKLNWATSSEKNNSHFLVEYSTDSENFEVIGRVEGNDNSAELIEYSFLHDRVGSHSNYYRLKQVDYDGSFTYTDVVYVKSDCRDLEPMSAKVYPNPTFGWLNADIVNSTNEVRDVQIMVTDVLGRIIYMEESILEPGENRNGVDLSAFSTGTYKFTIIYDSKKIETYNIIMIEN